MIIDSTTYEFIHNSEVFRLCVNYNKNDLTLTILKRKSDFYKNDFWDTIYPVNNDFEVLITRGLNQMLGDLNSYKKLIDSLGEKKNG